MAIFGWKDRKYVVAKLALPESEAVRVLMKQTLLAQATPLVLFEYAERFPGERVRRDLDASSSCPFHRLKTWMHSHRCSRPKSKGLQPASKTGGATLNDRQPLGALGAKSRIHVLRGAIPWWYKPHPTFSSKHTVLSLAWPPLQHIHLGLAWQHARTTKNLPLRGRR